MCPEVRGRVSHHASLFGRGARWLSGHSSWACSPMGRAGRGGAGREDGWGGGWTQRLTAHRLTTQVRGWHDKVNDHQSDVCPLQKMCKMEQAQAHRRQHLGVHAVP